MPPGKFQRLVFTVTVAQTTTPGIYVAGAKAVYGGKDIAELNPQRVKVNDGPAPPP